MFLICTFAGITAGPIVGFLTGCCADLHSVERNKLLSGVVGWTLSAVAGVLLGTMITSNFPDQSAVSFSVLGIAVNGIVWTGWVASVCGAVAGVYTAAVMHK